jgi:hypothetical protein
LALLIVSVAAGGCMAFRAGETKMPAAWPPPAPPVRHRVSVVLQHEAVIGGKRITPDPAASEKVREVMLRAYADSNLFAGVRPGLAAGGDELQVDVALVNSGDPHTVLAVLSGITMTMLPTFATDEYTMKTAVRDGSGAVLAEVERHDALTTWIQLFLVFGTFARPPNAVAEAVLYDMTRASIDDLRARGVW